MREHFYTESLNIVAWLISKGFNIKSQTKLDNKTIFYFDRSDELNKAINEYNNNLELKRFITSFKQVKQLIRK